MPIGITLLEAARLTGRDKSTIRRQIRAGKLSATRDANGTWLIEPCELERLHSLHPADDTTAVPRDAPPESAVSTTDALVAELRATLAQMQERLADKDRTIDRAYQDIDHMRVTIERLSLALPKASETVIAMPSGQGAAPPEAAAPVDRPALTRKQRLVKFWFGNQYRRRAA
jgi:Tfp pilus assembly protein FimV